MPGMQRFSKSALAIHERLHRVTGTAGTGTAAAVDPGTAAGTAVGTQAGTGTAADAGAGTGAAAGTAVGTQAGPGAEVGTGAAGTAGTDTGTGAHPMVGTSSGTERPHACRFCGKVSFKFEVYALEFCNKVISNASPQAAPLASASLLTTAALCMPERSHNTRENPHRRKAVRMPAVRQGWLHCP